MNHRAITTFVRTLLSAVLLVVFASAGTRAAESKPEAAQFPSTVAPTPSLAPGQRVRVSAASRVFTGMMVGTLVKIGPDSLVLVDPERNVVSELPRESITRVEVGRQRRQTRKWALIGLGVGVVGALLVTSDTSQSCTDYASPGDLWGTPRTCTKGEKVALAAVSVGVYSGLGAIIGHRKKTDDWSDAPREDWKPRESAVSFRVSPILSREARGAGLRLRLTW